MTRTSFFSLLQGSARAFAQTALWAGLAILLLPSCSVQEGPGGSGVITGRLFTHDYNSDFTQLNGSYYVPDEDVFLVYGDEEIYGDDMKTHYDGRFRFEYLRKGKYTVYAYSKDSTLAEPSGVYPVMVDVEITGKSEVVDIGEILIIK